MLTRLPGCKGWSTTLLFACNKVRFSCDKAQISFILPVTSKTLAILSAKELKHFGYGLEGTRFIQASVCKIQGLPKDSPTVFKDWEFMKNKPIYNQKIQFLKCWKNVAYKSSLSHLESWVQSQISLLALLTYPVLQTARSRSSVYGFYEI